MSISSSSSSSSSSQGAQNAQGQIKVIAGDPIDITQKRWGRSDKIVPGQQVRFEAGSRLIVEVAARVFEDHEVNEVLEKLSKSEGRGSNKESKYVAVDITGTDGKKKYYLMLAEEVKQALGDLPDKKDKSSYVIPASELFNFIVQRDKEVMMEAALIKKIREMKKSDPTSKSVGHGDLERATTGMGLHQEVHLRAMERTMTAQGIEPEQAKHIREYVSDNILTGKYRDTREYRAFKALPGAEQSEGFRIDKTMSLLHYSILVGNDGSIELLLKTKTDDVSKEDRISARGGDKTVKTSLDLMTGQIRVQVTIDISAPVWAKAESRRNWAWLEPQQMKVELENLAMERIELIKKYDYDIPNEVCGLKASNFTIHSVHATPLHKVNKRTQMDKPIRAEGDIVVSYTMVKADGDLTNIKCIEKIRGQPMDGVHVSPQFKKAIISMLQQVKKLHERNPSLVHRDIKLQNIFVLDEEAYLMDLGFAKEVDAQGRADGSIAGTLYSISPELAFLRFDNELVNLKQELALLKRHHNIIDGPAFEAEAKDVREKRAEIFKKAKEFDLRKGDLYSLGASIFEMALMSKGKDWLFALTKFGYKAESFYVQLKHVSNNMRKAGIGAGDIPDLEKLVLELGTELKEMGTKSNLFRAEDTARLLKAKAPPGLQALCYDLMEHAEHRIDVDEAIKQAERLITY